MKKMLSRLTAATLAAGMLVTEASASLVVPESTDPGTIAGSGMWLVQVYNVTDDDKQDVDYGIDLSEVAGTRFTFEVDLDNPDLGDMGLEFFEGNIGGGITLSCNGGDIYPYKDMPDVEYDSSLSYETSEVHNTYNWACQSWWGCEFVNAQGETVDTNPNTTDDDPANDNPLTTVNLGDYTYSITADFVNPLTCETDDWDINEIDVMQVCLQEWGTDIVPIEVTKCEILDAEGNVLIWFDGQGKPSLENKLAGNGSDDSDSDESDSVPADREVISESGTTILIADLDGNVEGTLISIHSTYAGGAYELKPGDRVDVTVAPVDDTVDTSEWVVAYNCFTSEWGGWHAVQSEAGELELSATVQDMMNVIDITDIADFGGFIFQVWNTEANVEVDWTLTITPDNSGNSEDYVVKYSANGVTTTYADEDGNVEGDMLWLYGTNTSGDIEFGIDDIINVSVAPVDDSVDSSEWYIWLAAFTDEYGGWSGVSSQSGELELTTTVEELMTLNQMTDISEFGGFFFMVSDVGPDVDIEWSVSITSPSAPSDDSDDNSTPDLVLDLVEVSEGNKGCDIDLGGAAPYISDDGGFLRMEVYAPLIGDDSAMLVDPEEFIDMTSITVYFSAANVNEEFTAEIYFMDADEEYSYFGEETEGVTSYPVTVTEDGSYSVSIETDGPMSELMYLGIQTNILYNDNGGTDEPAVPVEPEYDGWMKFYMQNRGGNWAWFENDKYTIHFSEEGTYELSWTDVQSVITDMYGESLLVAPIEEWESYPSLGIEIGSQLIREDGDKGRVSARIEDITITLIDGRVITVPTRVIDEVLTGTDEDWGFVGYNVNFDFGEIIKKILEIEDYQYFEILKKVDSITATVMLNEFIACIDEGDDLPDNSYTADAVEVTDIKVADNEVTFSWTESANADSYNIYLVDGDTRTFVAKTTELTYTYVGEYCTEYTIAVCGCAGEREGSLAEFTVTTNHDYEDEYTIDREPTCSIAGAMSIHCKHCDARTNITEIETIDHDYSSVVVAPTYEREGYTLHMCVYCNDSYKTDATEMLALPAMTGVAVASRDAGSITFKWDEYLGLDVDGTMLGYVIEEMVDGEVRAGEDIDDITITQWKYTGLRSSTEYTIRIRAYGVDNTGNFIFTKGVILENVATLPASMTGFAVTGRGSDNLTLSWNKNATADGYVVQIQENNSWKNIAVIKSADTTSHVVTGLEPNSFYRFRMVAYKSYGTAKLYSKYTGAIPGYTAPAMVTGLTVSASTDTTMTVTWDENAYADGFILDIYKDGKWQQAADVTSAETSVVVEGLTASTLYKFRIKSYASNGSLVINSTYSASVSGTTKPAAMSGVKVSASTSTSLTVSWDKNASATGYILQMYTDGAWKNIANIKDVSTTSYVATGLSASTLYKFRMVAYNNSTGSTLYGKYTGAISGTTAPAAVTNVRMTNRGTDFISIAWDKNTNATGYMVYIYDGTSWKLVKTLTSASSVSHKITGLESGKEYKVNVKAYKTSGTQKLIADASMITATTL